MKASRERESRLLNKVAKNTAKATAKVEKTAKAIAKKEKMAVKETQL